MLQVSARQCRASLEKGADMEPQRFLRRKAASKYLREVHGVFRQRARGAVYAVLGGGPVFQRIGRDPVYTPVNLDEWVASKLSGPMRSTSDDEGRHAASALMHQGLRGGGND
jgi:hypothetical protein